MSIRHPGKDVPEVSYEDGDLKAMKNARVLPILLLSALAGAVLTANAAAESARVAGQVIAVAGPVTVMRPEVTPHPLKFRDKLYWRDVVDARKEGIARVLLGGKATVTVRELSRLELREERRVEGVRYVADLVSGKMRASVARMLMRPGEQVEVWTFNSIASVRGTDFIVETVERPNLAGTFGLLGGREVAQAVGDSGTTSRETVIVTLSGLVDVSNRLASTGRVEQIGAYDGARVSGNREPVRFQISADDLKLYLKGLIPPRPQEARSGDRAEGVGDKVERVAQTASRQSASALGRADSNGNGLALGQVSGGGSWGSGGGNGNGFALGHANLAKKVGKGKKK